jgi:hypothetical protein
MIVDMVNNQNQNSNPTPATATVAPSQARGEIRSPLISAINITKMELVAIMV